MKKIVKIGGILLLIGMLFPVILITLIDPNDYRQRLTHQIEKSTGYHALIKGNLRFHLLPQLSVLADDIQIKAPGAEADIAHAGNMRVDIAWLPLLSKKIVIKNILIKNAIITLANETKPVKQVTASTNNTPTSNDNEIKTTSRALGVNNVNISNSVLLIEKKGQETLAIRDINIVLSEKVNDQIAITANATLNRNQKNIITSFKGLLDLAQLKQQIAFTLDKLEYQLIGSGLPATGINGTLSGHINYQFTEKLLTLAKMTLSANALTLNLDGQLSENKTFIIDAVTKYNKNNIHSKITGTFSKLPYIDMSITGDELNIDKLINDFSAPPAIKEKRTEQKKITLSETAIATPPATITHNPLTFLNAFDGQLNFSLAQLIVNGISIENVNLKAKNNHGNLLIEQLTGQLLQGNASIKGTLNANHPAPLVNFLIDTQKISIEQLSKHLSLPPFFQGDLTINGNIKGKGLSRSAFENDWQAKLSAHVLQAQINNLNLKQIIVNATAFLKKTVDIDEIYEKNSRFDQLSAQLWFDKGQLDINNIDIKSPSATIQGAGKVTFNHMQCDFNLAANIRNWQGKQSLVKVLETATIPLHIYGPCNQLAYQVSIDSLFTEQAKEKVNKAIDKYLNKLAEKSVSTTEEHEEQEKKLTDKVLDKLNKKR